MDVALGVVIGLALAASLAAGWRLVATPRRVIDPGGAAMQSAVHAATSLLRPLRQGFDEASAQHAAPHLRVLTGAIAVGLAGQNAVMAFDGAGADHHHPGDRLAELLAEGRDDRVHVEPHLTCTVDGCPLRSAIVAPLVVQNRRVGTLIAFYERPGRLRLEQSRVITEASALVSAMIELSEVEAQEERLAGAELRALRAQISPHFIYNALTAVASFIHSRPEEARDLLIEFADFIRYAFARQRPYVTVADELRYVERYLRLEQARFGARLRVSVQVDPEVLQAVVPVLSLQPIVENAVRHGVEVRPEGGLVRIEARDLGADVVLRVHDDGDGIDSESARVALTGRGPGIGLGNVHGRLLMTFGSEYGLSVAGNGDGTTVEMTVPKFRAGVRAA
jgi:two-component system LytT family sensor kinase